MRFICIMLVCVLAVAFAGAEDRMPHCTKVCCEYMRNSGCATIKQECLMHAHVRHFP
jgi:hypothetical protein